MPALSLLLRVLLSISLILNGSGYAMAGTHVQAAHADTAALAPQQAPDYVTAAAPPCHEHQDGQSASASAAPLPDTIADPTSTQSEHPSPDCCKSGACRCACVHQAPVAVPAYCLDGAVIEHAGIMHPLKPGHAAPALPHLIRPPIG